MKNVKEKIKNILRYGILSIIIPLISGLLYDINHFLIIQTAIADDTVPTIVYPVLGSVYSQELRTTRIIINNNNTFIY